MTPAVALLLMLPLAPGQTSLRLGQDAFRVGDDIQAVAPSPEGWYYGVVGDNGVHVLEAASGRVLRSWACAARVEALAIAESGRVAVCDAGGTLAVHDIATGVCVRRALPGVGGAVRAAEFLCGGSLLRVEVSDQEFAFSVPDGRPVVWAKKVPEGVLGAALAHDGSRRAVFVPKQLPRLLLDWLGWDAERCVPVQVQFDDPRTGRDLGRVNLPVGMVAAAAFLPDGASVLVLTSPRPLLVDVTNLTWRWLDLDGWQREDGWPTQQTTYGRHRREWGLADGRLAVSADGSRVAFCSRRGEEWDQVREWELATGRLLGERVFTEEFGPNVGYLPGGRLRLWTTFGPRLNVGSLDQPTPILGHRHMVADLRFSADGRRLRSLDLNGLVLDWELPTGRLVGSWAVPSRGGLGRWPSLRLHSDGARVLRQEGDDLYIYTAGVAQGERRAGNSSFEVVHDGRWAIHVSFGVVVAHDRDRNAAYRLEAEDLWTNRVLRKIQGRWQGRGVQCDPTAQVVALSRWRMADEDAPEARAVVFLRLADRKVVWRGEDADLEAFTADGAGALVRWSGRRWSLDLATGSLRSLPSWNLTAGEQRVLATTADGRLVLVEVARGSGLGYELCLVELATGSFRQRWATSLPSCVTTFSPDGRWLASALPDATIRVRSTALAGERLDPASLWRDLGSGDAAVAGLAVEQLSQRGDAVRYLRGWVRGWLGPAPDLVDAANWLRELDHDDADQRERARVRFRTLERATLVQLAGSVEASLEVRRALRDLAENPEEVPSTREELRQGRVVEVLERIGTPAARELLTSLRDGARSWALRHEAAAALRRQASFAPGLPASTTNDARVTTLPPGFSTSSTTT